MRNYLTFWRNFPEAMQYYLVMFALQYVVLLTLVYMHLARSEYVYL